MRTLEHPHAVLILDPEATASPRLARAFAAAWAGCVVHTDRAPADALARAQQEPPDLAVVTLGPTAPTAERVIPDLHRGGETTIVALTPRHSTAEAQRCLRLGADACLAASTPLAQLTMLSDALYRAHLDTRRLAADLRRTQGQLGQAAESLRTAQGSLAAAEHTIRQLQAARRAQEQLTTRAGEGEREARAGRRAFAAQVVHELRTPLMTLSLYAGLATARAESTPDLAPELRAQIERGLVQQAAALGRLIAQLAEAARVEHAGPLPLERRPTDLVELARDLVATVQAATGSHSLTLRAPGELVAEVDAWRLAQVLQILLDNAVKYSPAGGPITVELARPQPGWVRLTVTDTGMGVAVALRPHLFTPYFRGHPGAALDGLGLGLYVAQALVREHGGTISAEFPPGATCFAVELPTAARTAG